MIGAEMVFIEGADPCADGFHEELQVCVLLCGITCAEWATNRGICLLSAVTTGAERSGTFPASAAGEVPASQPAGTNGGAWQHCWGTGQNKWQPACY
jgi:hypothetical protein